jgi:hypothetical protein
VTREQRRQWRRYVFGCTGLTHAQRLILLALEGFADYPAGTNARPGVMVLAAMCGLGQRVVKSALDQGRDLKLIEQTARANPKLGRVAVYRLLPAPISRCTSVHVETDFKVHETDFKVHETAFQGARACPNTNPYQSLNTKGGGLPNAGTSPEQPPPPPKPPPPKNLNGEQPSNPPPRYCPAHTPNGTNEPCGACAQARHDYGTWKKTNTERITELKATIRAAINNCEECDEYGRPFNGPSQHCPRHPNFRQLAELAKPAEPAVPDDTTDAERQQKQLMEELVAKLAATKGLPP